ncbi:TPA: hypothetical protein NJ776_000423 [Vibrio parahaemolyticus]|nr:hypothetical protein [Vibrio parahaemolyticus]HCM0714251.1 hypothetical protein [Vibrio parahaemolyticus]HCM0960252.1 hypothetical protein [Vibrio parahaemolyticus]
MKAVWEGTAKKFNGLGLSGISMACTGLALVIASPQELLLQCALYLLMLNAFAYANLIKCLSFEGLFNEVSRND